MQQPPTHQRLVRLSGAVVALFVFAACGVGSDDGGGDVAEITVDMAEFFFEPADASVTAGEEVTLTANNIGSIRHEWVLLQAGVRLEDEADKPADEAVFQNDFVFYRVDVEAGASETTTFVAPSEPGLYQFVCAIAGHLSAGMTGELEVVAP